MLTPEQFHFIENQLGRPPRGVERVAVATPEGVPVVLEMRPLVEDKPFPTLWWLCSRDLGQAIAEIETRGWIKQMEARLQAEPALREALSSAHQRHVETRWLRMRPEDRARVEALGFGELFDRYGIGGIARWERIRCLHMYYAHHLCEGNPIGCRLDEEFGLDRLKIRG